MASILQATSVLLLALLTSAEGVCPDGGDVAIHSDYKSGEQLCCQTIRCEPGYEAVVCSPTNPYSTTCRRCPENTFQPDFTSSVEMLPCQIKQSCRNGMKVENDLSPVKDRRCICDVEHGLCNSSRSRSQFCQLGNCSAGLQLNPDCSCSECESGFFKETNGTSRCRRWKNCEEEGLETLSEGSAVTDRVCGQQIVDARKNPSPSPSVPVSTNNTTSPEMPNTTEMADRNESTIGNNGDNTIWTYVLIFTGVFIFIILIVAVILVAKRKRWLHYKNQPPTPGSQLDAELDAVGRNTENHTLLRTPETELTQNRNTEENTLLGASNHQTDAVDRRSNGQLPTLSNGDIEQRTDPTIQQPSASPYGSFCHVPDWKRKLNSCRVNLVTNICYTPRFISYLMINDTIPEHLKEVIEAKETRMKRIDELMDILPRRPSYAFPTLILTLVLTDQFHLAKEIDADMAQTFLENRDHLQENHIEVLESFELL